MHKTPDLLFVDVEHVDVNVIKLFVPAISTFVGYWRNSYRTFIRHDCYRRENAGEGR